MVRWTKHLMMWYLEWLGMWPLWSAGSLELDRPWGFISFQGQRLSWNHWKFSTKIYHENKLSRPQTVNKIHRTEGAVEKRAFEIPTGRIDPKNLMIKISFMCWILLTNSIETGQIVSEFWRNGFRVWWNKQTSRKNLRVRIPKRMWLVDMKEHYLIRNAKNWQCTHDCLSLPLLLDTFSSYTDHDDVTQ
jgi:hypothetical protein